MLWMVKTVATDADAGTTWKITTTAPADVTNTVTGASVGQSLGINTTTTTTRSGMEYNLLGQVNYYHDRITSDASTGPSPSLVTDRYFGASVDTQGNLTTLKDAVYNSNGQLYSYTEAIKEFEKVVSINPDLTEAYISLGISYGKLNQYENAIKIFKKVIEKNDSNAEAHYNLGVAYYKTGDLKDAKQEWEKTLNINPNYPLVKEHLSHIFGK